MSRVEEISLKDIRRMSFDALVTLRMFLANPSEETWNILTLERLKTQRNRLIEKGTPESEWPLPLKGDDWETRLMEALGMNPKEIESKASVKESSTLSSEIIKAPDPSPDPVPPPVVSVDQDKKKRDDPFRSDSYGSVIGESETGDPFMDEALKSKRNR